MGIFLESGFVENGAPLVANENYEGSVGAYDILTENVQNDMAMFNVLVGGDFKKSQAIHENAGEDTLVVLTESAGTRLFDNMKAFIKKAYEKIKGLLKSFITRLQTVVTRDNKKLVDRHRATVMKKDLRKFKYQWRVCKEDKSGVFPKAVKDTDATIANLRAKIAKESDIDVTNATARTLAGIARDEGKLNSSRDQLTDPKNKANTVASSLGITNASELEYGSLTPSIMDALYDEKEEIEGLDQRLLGDIMQVLTTSKDVIDGLQKAEKKLDSDYNKELRNIEKIRNEFTKMVPGGGEVDGQKMDKQEASRVVKGANYLYDITKLNQELMTKTINTNISIIKIKTKECRAAFSRAAAYRGVSEGTDEVVEGDKDTAVEINIEIEDQEEDEELMEAIDDDAENIVEEQFTGGNGY